MHGIFLVWRFVERVAAILLVVCLCLYVIRCLSTMEFLTLTQFGRYVQGLIAYICT